MPRKYIKAYRVTVTRVIRAITSSTRFYQFYSWLKNFCENVTVKYIRSKRMQRIKFELEVTY